MPSEPAPPPIPVVPPPVPTTPTRKPTPPWVMPVVLGAGLLVLIAFVGIVAAIMIPTVGKVRETAQRTTDSSHLRQIVQASLLYAVEEDGRLPGRSLSPDGSATADRELATLQHVAAALANRGGLNDCMVWFSSADRATRDAPPAAFASVILHDDGTTNTAFMQQRALAWDFVTGLTTRHPPTTPVAWTRGLRRDGSWDRRTSVYGEDGGWIAFLGGNVRFYPDLQASPLMTPQGEPTSDIVAALPAGARIVGAGPGTLHGTESDGP